MRLYLENYQNTTQDTIVDRLCRWIDEGKNYCLVVPTSYLADLYRRKILDKRETVFDLRIMTFDDLISLPGQYRPGLLEESLSKLALLKAFEKINAELKTADCFFYRSIGFYHIMLEYIADMEKSTVFEAQETDPDFEIMNKIFNLYQKIKEEEGLQDRFDYYHKTSERSFEYENVIFDSFYELSPIEWRVLEALLKGGADIDFYFHLFPRQEMSVYETLIEDLLKWGFEKVAIPSVTTHPYQELARSFEIKEDKLEVNYQMQQCQNVYMEIYAIAEDIVRNRSLGIPYEDHAVIIEDENMKYQAQRLFEQYQVPCSIRFDYALKHRPEIKLIRSLLKKDDVFEFTESLISELSAYLSEKDQTIAWLDILHLLRNAKQESAGKIEDILELLKRQGVSGKAIKIIKHYKRLFLNGERLVKYLYCLAQKQRKRIDPNEKIIADLYDRLQEIMNHFLRHPSLLNVQTSLFHKIIHTIIEEIEYRGDGKGVLVTDRRSMRDHQIAYLYIPGLNQNGYPKMRKQDYYHSYEKIVALKKKNISVFDNEQLSGLDLLYFTHVLSLASDKIYFSTHTHEGTEDSAPSVYWSELLRLKPDDQISYYSMTHLTNPTTILIPWQKTRREALNGQWTSEKRIKFLSDQEQKNIPLTIDALSVTDLDCFSTCPQKFYYKKILKDFGSEKDDNLTVGTALHEFLFHWYREKCSNLAEGGTGEERTPLFEDALFNTLMAAGFSKEVAQYYQTIYKFPLCKMIEIDRAYYEGGEKFKVSEYEKKVEVDIEGIKISGRIDRLDYYEFQGQKKVIMTDYKLNNFPVGKNRDDSLQFPVYLLCLPQTTIQRYLSVYQACSSIFWEYHDENESKKLLMETENNVTKIIQRIKAGDFRVSQENRQHCRYCEFNAFCPRRY